MGLIFGKYVIGFEDPNGRTEFYMSMSKDREYIYTTKDIENAEKFLSYDAARDFYYRKLEGMPVFDFRVAGAYVYKKSNFVTREPM